MKLIDRNDIENWGQRFGSKGDFPTLVSRLVRATTPLNTQVDFPAGSAAFVGGWDGVVNCPEERSFVPAGVSLWEFGTESDVKGKADDDFEKRSLDSLGHEKRESTFVFITTRLWKQKTKWVEAKKKLGTWRDVRVYDSSDLEQWLDEASAVSRWFSSYLGKYPSDGIITIEEFWNEFALCEKGELSPEIITSGRGIEANALQEFLCGVPGIFAVQASSTEEAIAFIIASAKQFEEAHQELFFSKSLIISSAAHFRSIRINTSQLNLIAHFENQQVLYAAAAQGHHVLVPLGPDNTSNQKTIILPVVDRIGFLHGLTLLGIGEVEAEQYSKESGRSITILKRLLGFANSKAEWLEKEDLREIIPAMLLGRWNQNFKGDTDIIEDLSGMSYVAYNEILLKWRDFEDSPIIQIGETWRLKSPLDLWNTISYRVPKNMLVAFQQRLILTFRDKNPFEELASQVSFPGFTTQRSKVSNWAKEGLLQSLILIGVYGERFRITTLGDCQGWVDRTIEELFTDLDGDFWVLLNQQMPLIAEASPNSFLNAVEDSLRQTAPPVMKMFVEEEGLISPSTHHTGLLWALEGLCWMPEFLTRGASILLNLAKIDPGGSVINRPINSLVEIFRPWHYQTLADFDTRMSCLAQIASKEQSVGWTLLLKLLPESHPIGRPTYKLRWRMFEQNTHLDYTWEEIGETHSFVAQQLLNIFEFHEWQLAKLLRASTSLSKLDRDTILNFVSQNCTKVDHTNSLTWNSIRKILGHHRSFPDADWALPEETLAAYQDLYYKLIPQTALRRNSWLFDDMFPEHPEGSHIENLSSNESHTTQEAKTELARKKGIQEILDEFGLEGISKLLQISKERSAIGDSLAAVLGKEFDIAIIFSLIQSSRDSDFLRGFIVRQVVDNGLQWVLDLFIILKQENIANGILSQILNAMPQTQLLWDFLKSQSTDIQKEYWEGVNPQFHFLDSRGIEYGVDMLNHYGRHISAVKVCSVFFQQVSTKLLIDTMFLAATKVSEEEVRFREYEVGKIFEVLDIRNDADQQDIMRLEWMYLPILSSGNVKRSPKLLHDELSKSPEFFVEALKFVYTPDDKGLLASEREGLTDKIIADRAFAAYKLLDSWKCVPGLQGDNSVDEDYLSEWVIKVRILALNADRLRVADSQIGKILASYPEGTLSWPHKIICTLIENINTESLKDGYGSALFNKRGSSIRGPFDGGDIERGHAEYFEKFAKLYKISFPNVAGIFSRLAKGYRRDAKMMDESAERDKLEY